MIKRLSIISILFLTTTVCWCCTIFCARDQHGQMWAGNNEDFYWYNFSTHIQIVTETDSTLAFIFFDYPNNNFPQGGINEAGLFFDINLVEASEVKNVPFKKVFPGSSSDLMLHMLGRCKSVHEVIELFDSYSLSEMNTAQIHLADKQGNKGIITADSSWLSTQSFQVSTNYNLCHKDDDYKRCWRYPIATSLLKNSEPSFELFSQICDSTAQRQGAFTIYSNVHNLTTGEIWLYYAWNYNNPYKTSFKEMTQLGDTTILFRDLFPEQLVVQAYNKYKSYGFKSGLDVLKNIKNLALRKEKLKLISLDALFLFDFLLQSGRIETTDDDDLISEIIDASDDTELLMLITNQKVSQHNKEMARKKLESIQKSRFNDTLALLAVASIGFIVILIFAFKRKTNKQLTNAKNE